MKITLTTAKALETLEGISSIIKGYEAIVPGPDGKDRAVPVAYKLDAQTTMRLKMNFKNLEPIAKSFEETRAELVTRLAKGGSEIKAKDAPQEFAEYLTEVNKMLADEHEIDLYKIDEAKLLDRNDNLLPIVMRLGAILNETVLTD